MTQNSQPGRDWFQLVLRIVLGGVFLFAAVPKIISPDMFYLDILGYDIVTGFFAKAVALWIPWIELLAATGVIFGIWYLASLRIFQGLLAFFTVLLIVTIIRGITADCGCFGSVGGQVTWGHVFGDMVLLLVATFLASWSNFREKAQEGIEE